MAKKKIAAATTSAALDVARLHLAAAVAQLEHDISAGISDGDRQFAVTFLVEAHDRLRNLAADIEAGTATHH